MPAGRRSLGEAVVKFFTDSKQFDKGVKAMEGKLTKLSNRLKRTGDGMTRMGKSLGKAGVLMAAPLVAAGKGAITFQSNLAEVSTLMSDVTDVEMRAMGDGDRKSVV